ncbi:hypothetical protein NT239_08705 [Chitinibacter sp. SCUT-21]|uniref:alpha/beta hydrolase family protein n=1 Tax=Chitinibacter sp. SCUT-21 TaxID=2970891 RepID=UPI0035A661E0
MILAVRFLLMALCFCTNVVYAAMGLTQIAARNGAPEVTVFYPALGAAPMIERAKLRFAAAVDAPVQNGNGRLIVMSHGSGSTAWAYADLAAQLVQDGFIVAVPTHQQDNAQNSEHAGPESWKTRPAEISAAIDVIARTPRFAQQLKLDRVGLYGLSAGGHTALTFAGGRWSPARMIAHCQTHIRADFNACAGLVFAQQGNWLDDAKAWLVQRVLSWRFSDATVYAYHDPRIAAIVAGVPYAADFDLNSLRNPRVPLALITARQDVWLHPQFHSDALLNACQRCIHLHDFKMGGHGAMLSPSRHYTDPLLIKLLGDLPQFDRRETALVNQKVSQYFRQQLLAR